MKRALLSAVLAALATAAVLATIGFGASNKSGKARSTQDQQSSQTTSGPPPTMKEALAKMQAQRDAQQKKLAKAPALHPIQQAWIDEQVPQCGYCQNGMMITAADLLQRVKRPTEEQIASFMNGHICRCGTYQRITKAINRAAKVMA